MEEYREIEQPPSRLEETTEESPWNYNSNLCRRGSATSPSKLEYLKGPAILLGVLATTGGLIYLLLSGIK